MVSLKYIAELRGVRELALHGAADVSWWRKHLAGEDLEPVDVDGRARVIVTGLDARWRLWPFRDLSVTVLARRSGAKKQGVCLARAFNASRFIVFFEARWFKLPYSRRPVRVDLGDGATMRLGDGEVVGRMGPREPAGERDMGFEGPVFLPGRRYLRIRTSGPTSTYDFDAGRDRFEVAEECGDPVLSGLRHSGFVGVQWRVSENATHARTKTFAFDG